MGTRCPSPGLPWGLITLPCLILQMFLCNYCRHTFSSREAVVQHTRSAHRSARLNFTNLAWAAAYENSLQPRGAGSGYGGATGSVVPMPPVAGPLQYALSSAIPPTQIIKAGSTAGPAGPPSTGEVWLGCPFFHQAGVMAA